jgi:hypothetical protein
VKLVDEWSVRREHARHDRLPHGNLRSVPPGTSTGVNYPQMRGGPT